MACNNTLVGTQAKTNTQAKQIQILITYLRKTSIGYWIYLQERGIIIFKRILKCNKFRLFLWPKQKHKSNIRQKICHEYFLQEVGLSEIKFVLVRKSETWET